MASLYFENTNTKRKYRVVSWDTDTNEMVLEGPHGQFPMIFNKEQFKKLGYRPIQVEDNSVPDVEDDDDA